MLSNKPLFVYPDRQSQVTNTDTLKNNDDAKEGVKNTNKRPHVTLEGSKEKREIDTLDKDKFGCQLFKVKTCGIFSHPQIYYYNMKDFNTEYYINSNDTQISGLVYQPLTQTFYGLQKQMGKDNYQHVELDDEWVNSNFDKKFIALTVEKAVNGQNKFIKVPIGIARPTITLPECKNNPIIQYLQNGEDTCVYSSISSALHYIGYIKLAVLVDSFKYASQNDILELEHEKRLLKVNRIIRTGKCYPFNKQFLQIRIKNAMSFNLLQNAKLNPTTLFHVVLRGTDCSENHCICIFDNWIFDGNFTNALTLNQLNLDLSVNNKFVNVKAGYMYVNK